MHERCRAATLEDRVINEMIPNQHAVGSLAGVLRVRRGHYRNRSRCCPTEDVGTLKRVEDVRYAECHYDFPMCCQIRLSRLRVLMVTRDGRLVPTFSKLTNHA